MGSVSLSEKKKKVVKKRSKAHKLNIKSGRTKVKKFKNTKNERRKKIRYRGKGQGLIYIGHIPHGFYEDEMKSYFDQFGRVISATLIRSKKTGRSRGYGFVEFKDEEVAKIAAETMNNYLMFNRIIKCRYIPPEERKNRVFARKITSTDYPRKRNRISNMKNKMKALSNSDQSTYLKKTQKKINEFRQFFEERGINFTFKITNKSSKDNDQDNMNEENEKKSSNIDLKSKPKEEVDDQFGVLEIDESDDDIYFKTPPQVKKVIKSSSNNPVATVEEITQCDNSPAKKAKKINKLKNLNSNKSQEKKQKRNKSRKTKEGLSPVIQKQKKMKKNEKLLVKSVKAKKRPVEKNILNAVTKKNEKTQKNVSNLTISKKKSKLS